MFLLNCAQLGPTFLRLPVRSAIYIYSHWVMELLSESKKRRSDRFWLFFFSTITGFYGPKGKWR